MKISSIVLSTLITAVSLTGWQVHADSGFDHQTAQARPVLMGTSGGNIQDRNSSYCCSGTLGCLVQDGNGTQYILSNNHVLGKTNQGIIGDAVSQPGLIDAACSVSSGDYVGYLSDFVVIDFSSLNSMDAAIAEVIPGTVDPAGGIIDIGQVSTTTLNPKVRTRVKKSGRTTGHTTGKITSVNVTVNVQYGTSCGIGSQIATFDGQFIVGTAGFSAGGDSGALIVENKADCPRPVGLLFAGSDTITIGTPISDVLNAFGVTMVGCAGGDGGDGGGGGGGGGKPGGGGGRPFGGALEGVDAASVAQATEDKLGAEADVFGIDGVVGMGVGSRVDNPGKAAVEVYIEADDPAVRGKIPQVINRTPVKVIVTGRIVAF